LEDLPKGAFPLKNYVFEMGPIDTHCHIYSDRFSGDIGQVIERAREAEIGAILMPNIDSGSISSMLKLEEKYPSFCIPMMGLHPCSIQENYKKEIELVRGWFEKRPFLAVGEIGLDLYWDKTRLSEQILALEEQFDLAASLNIPAVIHCREAFHELVPILRKYSKRNLKAVLHCFTGTIEEAKECIDLGYYLGIGGVFTFKNSGLKDVISSIGLDKILLETDAPYLAPVPHRGKRNEPSYVSLVAKAISELLNMELDSVFELTNKNAEELFLINSWKS
jgi:TatD DNase family protein